MRALRSYALVCFLDALFYALPVLFVPVETPYRISFNM